MELDPAIPIVQSVCCAQCKKLSETTSQFVIFQGNMKRMNTDRFKKNDPGVHLNCFDTIQLVFCGLDCLSDFITEKYNQKP